MHIYYTLDRYNARVRPVVSPAQLLVLSHFGRCITHDSTQNTRHTIFNIFKIKSVTLFTVIFTHARVVGYRYLTCIMQSGASCFMYGLAIWFYDGARFFFGKPSSRK